MLIDFPSLCLAIGAMLSTMKWTFIRRQAKPFQTPYNDFFCTRDKPPLVGVLDAENKLSASLSGN